MRANIATIVGSLDALRVVCNCKFAPRITWNLSKLLRECEKEVTEFTAFRDRAVRKYGDVIGDKVEVKPENKKDFLKELQEVLESEVELKVFPFKLTDINKGEVTPSQLAALFWIFDENEEIPDDAEVVVDRVSTVKV